MDFMTIWRSSVITFGWLFIIIPSSIAQPLNEEFKVDWNQILKVPDSKAVDYYSLYPIFRSSSRFSRSHDNSPKENEKKVLLRTKRDAVDKNVLSRRGDARNGKYLGGNYGIDYPYIPDPGYGHYGKYKPVIIHQHQHHHHHHIQPGGGYFDGTYPGLGRPVNNGNYGISAGAVAPGGSYGGYYPYSGKGGNQEIFSINGKQGSYQGLFDSDGSRHLSKEARRREPIGKSKSVIFKDD